MIELIENEQHIAEAMLVTKRAGNTIVPFAKFHELLPDDALP